MKNSITWFVWKLPIIFLAVFLSYVMSSGLPEKLTTDDVVATSVFVLLLSGIVDLMIIRFRGELNDKEY